MDRPALTLLLARVAEIRDEVADWESTVRSLDGGPEACRAIDNGPIELGWSLDLALATEDANEPHDR